MTALKCPVCGCNAVNSSRQEGLRAQQPAKEDDPKVVMCHCVASHRLVVSFREHYLALRKSITSPLTERYNPQPVIC
jgi:hypothetical protein